MENYAVVVDSVVTNMIALDSSADDWHPPEGAIVVLIAAGEVAGIGYTYDGKIFTAP